MKTSVSFNSRTNTVLGVSRCLSENLVFGSSSSYPQTSLVLWHQAVGTFSTRKEVSGNDKCRAWEGYRAADKKTAQRTYALVWLLARASNLSGVAFSKCKLRTRAVISMTACWSTRYPCDCLNKIDLEVCSPKLQELAKQYVTMLFPPNTCQEGKARGRKSIYVGSFVMENSLHSSTLIAPQWSVFLRADMRGKYSNIRYQVRLRRRCMAVAILWLLWPEF